MLHLWGPPTDWISIITRQSPFDCNPCKASGPHYTVCLWLVGSKMTCTIKHKKNTTNYTARETLLAPNSVALFDLFLHVNIHGLVSCLIYKRLEMFLSFAFSSLVKTLH